METAEQCNATFVELIHFEHYNIRALWVDGLLAGWVWAGEGKDVEEVLF